MGGLGHGAEIDEQAAASRTGDADGVGELRGVEVEQMSRCDRGPDRSDKPGRVKAKLMGFKRARRLPQPPLYLDAEHHRGQDFRAAAAESLAQRQCRRERRRKRVRGGQPHRLEVENMHGRAVDKSALCGSEPRVQPEQRSAGTSAALCQRIGEVLREQSRRFF
jgi:hypothetical protein